MFTDIHLTTCIHDKLLIVLLVIVVVVYLFLQKKIQSFYFTTTGTSRVFASCSSLIGTVGEFYHSVSRCPNLENHVHR